MADVRVAPAAFVADLKARWPDFRDVRWNDAVSRWEFVFASAAGQPVSQFYGWDRNPMTGADMPIDPITGLTPFRDLDVAAQHEIIAHGEATYLGNRVDQDHTWRNRTKRIKAYNDALHRKHRREDAENFGYALQQVDIRRPGWRMDHQPAKRGKGPLITVPVVVGAGKPRKVA
jgi:hypothetical protein